MIEIILPENMELRAYGDEYVLVGVGLTETRYLQIRKTLPPDIIRRIIGYRRIVG